MACCDTELRKMKRREYYQKNKEMMQEKANVYMRARRAKEAEHINLYYRSLAFLADVTAPKPTIGQWAKLKVRMLEMGRDYVSPRPNDIVMSHITPETNYDLIYMGRHDGEFGPG